MLTPEAPPPSPSAASSPLAPISSTPPLAKGELILVVDDQQNIRDLLVTVLEGHGYRTATAVDGNDALGVFKARSHEIAAVITDLHMPHTEGTSLADLLRQVRAGIPILFMSGLGESSNRQPDAPFDSKDPFLLKPFRPVVLLDAVHRLLQPRRVPQA